MPVKIKEEGGGMLKPRDTIARERGIILDVARVKAQTGVILINFKPRDAIARKRGNKINFRPEYDYF